jgi:hypothetical protein
VLVLGPLVIHPTGASEGESRNDAIVEDGGDPFVGTLGMTHVGAETLVVGAVVVVVVVVDVVVALRTGEDACGELVQLLAPRAAMSTTPANTVRGRMPHS